MLFFLLLLPYGNDKQEINSIHQVAVFINTIGNLEGKGSRGNAGHQQGANMMVQIQLIGVQLCLLSMRQGIWNWRTILSSNATKVNMGQGFQIVNGITQQLAMWLAWNMARATEMMGQKNQSRSPSSLVLLGATMQGCLQPLCQPPGVFMTSGRNISTGWWGKATSRLSSHSQHGCLNHCYHRQNIVCLVRQGHTADARIGRIYAINGGQQTYVTNIINGLNGDRKMGLWDPPSFEFNTRLV